MEGNDNLSFRVSMNGKNKYQLRILPPKLPHERSKIVKNPDSLRSELIFLEEIQEKTGLALQNVVFNRNKEKLTIMENDNGDQIVGLLLTWIEKDTSSEDFVLVGETLGRIHKCSQFFIPPSNFIRPTYNQDYFRGSIEIIKKDNKEQAIIPGSILTIKEAFSKILVEMANIEKSVDTWGVIHGDYGEGNYLFLSGKCCPIDFSLCGHGYFLYDVGLALEPLDRNQRDDFLTGYFNIIDFLRSSFKYIDNFFVLGLLECFSTLVSIDVDRSWLNQFISDNVEIYISNYIENKKLISYIVH
jgi:Ser/Thr protein kinase RdoA (MazF antagonist)